MSRCFRAGRFLGVVPFLLVGSPIQALAEEPVDVELVLAVDVSLSMSPTELEIQRMGYAAALTDPQVINAIADGAYGKIAVAYFEWAGSTTQRLIVPWTIVASHDDAERVAAQLSAQPPNSARRTSISGALDFGMDLLAESPFRGTRRVIDVSGDGPNNQGAPVDVTREAVIASGITINGLPLMTNSGFTSIYDMKDLDRYYADCVIGGPGAFMVPVNDWSQFPEAIRRKLVLELAGSTPSKENDPNALPVVMVQSKAGYDCLVGEKMWRDRSFMWDSR
ncbi:DUF1194 domain-containing protein [Pseudaminobacter sp. 19-2017]|uniref:DUF1194 domain-containing protein n=1 Tax=Pseudaminobacter soli (ex Zhang et al. 2022) TaxID=2831468 RepID=A0A942E062_9HYPH|nr:DUF1194 domain-containing protein [Pseudaminobacter soli]